MRAVEEAAYAEEDLRAARTLARSGTLGPISVERGAFGSTVLDDDRLPAVTGSLPQLDDDAWETFVELVAAESGRVAALLAGDLPYSLVEHAEESGVELLPYSGELGWGCTCDAWLDPCRHALAVGYQLAWLIDEDPFVLTCLRGLPRDDLLARLHARGAPDPVAPVADDLDLGLDAALRPPGPSTCSTQARRSTTCSDRSGLPGSRGSAVTGLAPRPADVAVTGLAPRPVVGAARAYRPA